MRISSRSTVSRWQRTGLWLLPLTLVIVGGCAGSRQVMSRQMLLPFTAEQREELQNSEAAPYTLQRGDVFEVQSLVDQELRQAGVLVLPDGTASLIHLGNMRVAGLSLRDLEELINTAYRREFRDVNLSVALQTLSGRKVYVLGEVQAPGLYDIGHDATGVMGVLAQAGGFTEWSSQGSIVVLRLTPEGYLSREFDITALRKGKAFDSAAFDLQPYDIIYVNRSKIGDFASFTKNVVASLVQYSRLLLDIRILESPELYRR